MGVELGHGQAAMHAVTLQLLRAELGSRHLRVGLSHHQTPQVARLACTPIPSFPTFFNKAAVSMLKGVNAGTSACVLGVECSSACQARGTREVRALHPWQPESHPAALP